MGSASDTNVNSCPRIHRTPWGSQNIPFISPESVGRCYMHQQEKKKRRGNASHESIKIWSHIGHSNNSANLLAPSKQQALPDSTVSKTTSDCSSSSGSYTSNKSKFCELACFCNPNRKERNRTLVVHESIRLSPCLAPGIPVTQRPFGQHKRYDRRRQRKTGKREKPLPKGFNRKSTISLSLQAFAFNSHSKQTFQLRQSMERIRKHMETERKAVLRFLPSKSTRNTTANPLRCFSYFTYHTLCSLSVSLSRKSRRTAKSTKPTHKNATKEPKKRKRKGKK